MVSIVVEEETFYDSIPHMLYVLTALSVNFALSSKELKQGAASSISDELDLVQIQEISLSDLMNHNLRLDIDGSVAFSFTAFLPSDSSVFILLEFNPRFLAFELFPSDPNRGLDIAPSYARFSLKNICDPGNLYEAPSVEATMYSNALLIMPPVPDMSMPFNVIAIASTLIAIFLGTSMRFITNKASERLSNRYKGIVEVSKGQKLLSKVKCKFTFIQDRLRYLKGHLKSKNLHKDKNL